MNVLGRTTVAALVFALVGLGLAGTVSSEPVWAPASTATIRPGVQLVSEAGQCTANFVFSNATDVFIGSAAHCTSTGGPTDTNGCDTESLPLGSPIAIEGASKPGTLAYNSWIAMQAANETDPNICDFNDFALVRIDPADVGKVNPTIPHWGGPTGLVGFGGTTRGESVYSYGNSSLRLGLDLLSPKSGTSVGTSGGGWNHTVYTLTPGIPGDSGSAFLNSKGEALGVLSTVALAPLALSNGVGDLLRELAYLNSHTNLGVQLALGTVAFTPNKVPLGL